jgi:hypothetical protein
MPGPQKPAKKTFGPHNSKWKKGVAPTGKRVGPRVPTSRPKQWKGFREAMRAAFETTGQDPRGERTLTQVVLAKAYDDGNPDQMNAIKFAAAYAYGMPKAGLDEETITKLGQEMAQRMFEAAIEEARKRRTLEATPEMPPITGQPDR